MAQAKLEKNMGIDLEKVERLVSSATNLLFRGAFPTDEEWNIVLEARLAINAVQDELDAVDLKTIIYSPGLGWNLMTSLMQPLGLTQSMVRIGPGWVAKGMGEWIKAPVETIDEINELEAAVQAAG